MVMWPFRKRRDEARLDELEAVVRGVLLGDVPTDARETSERYRETAAKLESIAEYANALHRRLDKLQGMVERPFLERASVPDGCELVLITTLRCKACKYGVPGNGVHNCAAVPAMLESP